VGRAAEVSKVADLLDKHELVTVTGPGGVGKTRLAGAVAEQVAGRFADGVWIAELAATLDPGLVPNVVAEALGLQLAPGVALADVLGRRQLLVVLDNCEHVLDAAASLCESLLAAADEVRVLATSREPLGVAGESRYRLGPLQLPAPENQAAVLRKAHDLADAVTLFADRARLADPSFVVDSGSAPIVAEIVTRLDGMPLAIELAAARVESMGVDQLAARLDDRLRLLTGTGRAAGGRHASLAAAADWSYRLLDGEQQLVFRALSVFPGPFGLEATEAVAGPSAGPTVLRLVDCSLVLPPRSGLDGRARYTLLETLRAFGSERLTEAAERESVEAAMAGYALEVAESAAIGLQTSASELPALSRLDADSAMLQFALAWALHHDSEIACRLAIALSAWWDVRSRWAEGYRLLTEASRHVVAGTELWCSAQNWLGYLSSFTSVPTSLSHVNALIDALTGSAQRVPMLALAHAGRATCLANLNRHVEAGDEARRALDLAAELGDPVGQAAALMVLGYLTWTAGDIASTLDWFRRAQELNLGAVPGWLARICNKYLAGALGDAGQPAEARQYATRSLELARQAGSLYDESSSLRTMAMIDVENGDMGSAQALLREAIGLYSRCGAGQLLLGLLQSCADVCARMGRWRETTTLIAARDAVSEATIHAVDPLPEKSARNARLALGEAEAQAAEQRGAAMTPDAAAGYALEVLADERGSKRDRGIVDGPLSPRERELVLLVAQGRTDAQIAAQLFISIRTVRSHLDRIRDKTGCRRRADLTRLALQAGLI